MIIIFLQNHSVSKSFNFGVTKIHTNFSYFYQMLILKVVIPSALMFPRDGKGYLLKYLKSLCKYSYYLTQSVNAHYYN